MSIRQLQYFVTLFDECHFGRAARQCGVTQSTFSVQLARLESSLGARLFVRTSRRVQATAVAYRIEPLARTVVEHCRQIGQLAGTTRPG